MERETRTDGRSEEEKEVDRLYNEMIERQLGPEARDVPLRSYVEGALGGITVVPDPSDLGFHYALPLLPEEVDREVEMARDAVAESYREIPLTSDGE